MISEGRKAPDLGMPTQAGNNLLHALVMKAKTERELKGMIDKLALKMSGKYKDAKDELITRSAVDYFNNKGNKGEQDKPDRNVFVQFKSAADLSGGSEIKLDDKSKIKVSKKEAEKVLKQLNKLKPSQRGDIQKAMKKDKNSFNKFFKILNR
jgi:hypothetical protein